MDDLVIVLAAWFLLGIASAIWIYFDSKRGPGLNWLWVVIGFLLSLIGLLAYVLIGRKKQEAKAYDPGDEFSKPDYQFEGEKKAPEAPRPPVEVALKKEEKNEEKKQVEPLEGCPRCPKCGAAISVYDFKCWDCGVQLRAH